MIGRLTGRVQKAAVTLAAAALLAGGCGGAGSTSAPVATSTVDLPPSYKFVPANISVTVGTTVTWTNHDNFTHSVQFLDGGLPSTPMMMSPGDNATFTFASAGTYRYQCSLHPQNMKGEVVVTP